MFVLTKYKRQSLFKLLGSDSCQSNPGKVSPKIIRLTISTGKVKEKNIFKNFFILCLKIKLLIYI